MQMIRLLPKGSCPKCGHRQFLVKEIQSNLYLTGIDGDVIDSKEEKYVAVGKCLNCGKEYNMLSGRDSFIPMTPLRELLYYYPGKSLKEPEEEYIDNPFEV